MKKSLFLFICLCVCVVANAQITYTPYIRESTPIPQMSFPTMPHPQHSNTPATQQVKATVQAVRNCLAFLPDGNDEPIQIDVHVKRFSDSARSLGIIQSGIMFTFSQEDGLAEIKETQYLDQDVASKFPYYVEFETNAGTIICFLPNLTTSMIDIYKFDSL